MRVVPPFDIVEDFHASHGVSVEAGPVDEVTLKGGEKTLTQSIVVAVADCYDNSMCESFFATLECELIQRNKFEDKAQGKAAVFKFIEGWYNRRRRHSKIDYLSPTEYERRNARCA